MTKEQLIDLISRYVPDGDEVALGGWWHRSDVEDFYGKLSDNQWSRFVYWYEKYQDNGADTDEALAFAMEEE
jgi:hypothetical protein